LSACVCVFASIIHSREIFHATIHSYTVDAATILFLSACVCVFASIIHSREIFHATIHSYTVDAATILFLSACVCVFASIIHSRKIFHNQLAHTSFTYSLQKVDAATKVEFSKKQLLHSFVH
jgi:hypothetical protein